MERRKEVLDLKIAHKEAEETECWLLLCEKAPSYPTPAEQMKAIFLSLRELLSKIISTAKSKK